MKAATTDTDVESVVPPRHADGQEDLPLLIAFLLGEEENGGFLRALEQYIQNNAGMAKTLETLRADGGKTELEALMELLALIARTEPDDDLPPELAPLAALFALFQPVPVFDGTDAGEGVTPEEQAGIMEDAASAAKFQTAVAVFQTAEITVSEDPDGNAASAAELPDTARVTGFRTEEALRAAYINRFAAVRAALLNEVRTDGSEDAGLDGTGSIQAEEPPAIPDLTGQAEMGAAFEQPESAADEKIAGKPKSEAGPGAVSGQQASPPQFRGETAEPVRQVLAGRIIDQIAAQAAKPQDISVLQMELHPKFLGRIQLVLEATVEGMTARLRSDNGAVRSLLNENLAELRNALRDAGINMKDVEVTESRIGAQLADRQHRRDDAGAFANRKDSVRIASVAALTAADEAAEGERIETAYATGRVSGGYADGSRFDYRA
jgi:hypothetical protein